MDNFLAIAPVVIALLTAVIVAGASLHQTHVANRLQRVADRLSPQLSQSIHRLERARELVITISTTCQQYANTFRVDRTVDPSHLVTMLTILHSSEVELAALSAVIADKEFNGSVQRLSEKIRRTDLSALDNRYASDWSMWLQLIGEPTENLFKRIYELLEIVTHR
jgi:hypothetical protein